MHLSTLQILADPTRFRIVELMLSGEHSVNDIVKNVDVDQSGVSRHLRILQEAGFAQIRPEGQKRFYSLCPGPFRDIDLWISRYRQLWEGRLDKFGEALTRKQAGKASGPQARDYQGENIMNGKSSRGSAGKIVIERTYVGSIEDVWELWTTKEGIESWWGPGGFSVKVHDLDLRAGGEMRYAMTAIEPAQVEFMKQAGMPLTTESKLTYTEVVLGKSIAYTFRADFIPGVEPYDVGNKVELVEQGERVRMVLTLDPMHSDEWTQRAVMGMESQLGKLAKVIAGRGMK